MNDYVKVSKTFTFEASHRLPKHEGKCSRLHGHSWKLKVTCEGPVNKINGMVLDYAIISDIVKKAIINDLDHSHLGTWEGISSELYLSSKVSWLPREFYPTSENLLFAIAERLSLHMLAWTSLTLYETSTSEAHLEPCI